VNVRCPSLSCGSTCPGVVHESCNFKAREHMETSKEHARAASVCMRERFPETPLGEDRRAAFDPGLLDAATDGKGSTHVGVDLRSGASVKKRITAIPILSALVGGTGGRGCCVRARTRRGQ
jgi:hypothetical protein